MGGQQEAYLWFVVFGGVVMALMGLAALLEAARDRRR